jgi:hypothetical protein
MRFHAQRHGGERSYDERRSRPESLSLIDV